MLKRLTPREKFEQLVADFTPLLRRAFLDAIDDITSNIDLGRIVERLERNDIDGAIRAMNLDEAAFRSLEEAIRQTYSGGGVAAVEQMPSIRDPDGYRVVFRFDIRNPVAEAWLRDHSGRLITNIVDDQRIAIRTALQEGLARGDNPRRTAINVAGKLNRATGRREGGIIGLTSQQTEYVNRARQELLSGDPESIRNYLQRKKRDRRFDRSIVKALREGDALPRETVDRITARYSDRLLKLRADTISLNETMNALGASRDEAFRQRIERGDIQAQNITKTWKHTPQERPRLQHMQMNGQKVRFDQPFIAPDGTMIPYPHAPGVPASHTLGCRCIVEYKIDFAAELVG